MNARAVSALRRALAGLQGLRLAYLYGSSLLRPDFRDVDIAVALSRRGAFDSLGARLKLAGALGRRLAWEFDVHLLQEMPLALQYRVIATGRCLLSRSDVGRTRYEAWVLNRFLDFKPAHDYLVEQSLRRAARP